MIAVRDSASLNRLYPKILPRLKRLRIVRKGHCLGWASILRTQMQNDRHFGNLCVGTIVDCLSRPDDADLVIASASKFLERSNVDLIVSNQLHQQWQPAFDNAGFLSARSNFVLATSPELTKLLDPVTQNITRTHINRGDGDGPIHL